MGAASGGQRQHRLVLERGLRQQVQKDLEHAAVGRLVHRGGNDDGTGPRHLGHRTDHRRVTEVRQQQGLGRQVANLQALHIHATQLQALLHGVQQCGGARGVGRATRDEQDGHGCSPCVIGV